MVVSRGLSRFTATTMNSGRVKFRLGLRLGIQQGLGLEVEFRV